jgi:hypothetical protein
MESYKPFPKQEEFHRCPATYRLFGGQAGPGKSRALLEETVLQAIENDGEDTLLLRRTFSELQESILTPFLRYIFPQWRDAGATYNDSKHLVRWPNGSTTQFGHAQHENDILQYQGGAYLFIGVDELTTFTLKMWQFLTSRNRPHNEGNFACMAGATNPGNIGHGWVKALWGCDGKGKRPAPGMERTDKYNPDDYVFIKATLEDNPIYANDAQYKGKLDALPTQMYRAFRLGDWELFAGQYFDVFNESCIQPANELGLKPWFPRWISGDWGFGHPACFHLHAQDGDRTITYAEIFDRQVVEPEWGKRIVRMVGNDRVSDFYLSPDAFAKRGSANSAAIQIGDALTGSHVPLPGPASTDRIGGARLIYNLLRSGLWTISSACPKLIESLPTLIHDEDNLEDVLKVDAGEGQIGDDAYDSARYGLYSKLQARIAPLAERVNDGIKAIAEKRGQTIQTMDVNDMAMAHRVMTMKEKRRGMHTVRHRVWHPQRRSA